MNTLLDMDNPFFSFMGRLADYVILNLLFLLTCLPVVTIGAALGAMHETLARMAEGTEGSLHRTYVQALIRNFKRALLPWLFLLATGSLLAFDVAVAADVLGESLLKLTMPVVGSLGVLWLLIFSWCFVLPWEQTEGFGERMKLALDMAVRNLPRSLLMIAVELFPVVCYFLFVRFFMGILLPFYICIGCSCTSAVCSLLAGRMKPESRRRQSDEEEQADCCGRTAVGTKRT